MSRYTKAGASKARTLRGLEAIREAAAADPELADMIGDAIDAVHADDWDAQKEAAVRLTLLSVGN